MHQDPNLSNLEPQTLQDYINEVAIRVGQFGNFVNKLHLRVLREDKLAPQDVAALMALARLIEDDAECLAGDAEDLAGAALERAGAAMIVA